MTLKTRLFIELLTHLDCQRAPKHCSDLLGGSAFPVKSGSISSYLVHHIPIYYVSFTMVALW